MIEQQTDYPCAGNHQGTQIMMVSFDPTLKKNQRLLCQKCLDDFQLSTKVEGYSKILDSIQDMQRNRVNLQQFLIEKMIIFIEPLQKVFQSVRENLLKSMDILIKVTSDWKQELQQISKTKIVYNIFDELESLVYRQQHHKQQMIFEQINKLNQTCTKTIVNQLLILKDGPFKEIELKLNNCEQMLTNLFLNYDNQIRINKKNSTSMTLKKISKVQSEIGISNIIFDKTGQMMISTNKGKVGVWNLDQGNLKIQSSFIAHKSEIQCAILISNLNSYIIIAADKTIKIFQRINEIIWKNVFESSKFNNPISCMIINGNENYVFISNQNVISVWKLNFLQNQMLTCQQQSLEQHQWVINSMSLNKSENKLISCSKDKKLIVWGLNRNNQWEYKYDVKQSILESGNAVCFLQDSQFIFVTGEQYGQDSVYVYEEQGEQFQEVLKKTLKLPKHHQNDFSISSVVYIDQQNKIILISQKNDIYLIRVKSDGSLCIITQINRAILNHQQSQSLAQNGKYLVYSYYDNKNDQNYFSVNEIIFS